MYSYEVGATGFIILILEIETQAEAQGLEGSHWGHVDANESMNC